MRILNRLFGLGIAGLLAIAPGCNKDKPTGDPANKGPTMTLEDSLLTLTKRYEMLNGDKYVGTGLFDELITRRAFFYGILAEQSEWSESFQGTDSTSREYKDFLAKRIKLIETHEKLQEDIEKLKIEYLILGGPMFEKTGYLQKYEYKGSPNHSPITYKRKKNTDQDSISQNFLNLLIKNIGILKEYELRKKDFGELRQYVNYFESVDSVVHPKIEYFTYEYMRKRARESSAEINRITNPKQLFFMNKGYYSTHLSNMKRIQEYIENKQYLNTERITGVMRYDKYTIRTRFKSGDDYRSRYYDVDEQTYNSIKEGDRPEGMRGRVREKTHEMKFFIVKDYRRRKEVEKGEYSKMLNFANANKIAIKKVIDEKMTKMQFQNVFSEDVFLFL